MVKLGVPYTEDQVKNASELARTQAKGIAADLAKEGATGLEDKEVVALIAYLQRLGTDIKSQPAQPVAVSGGTK
jgi:cytochrome c oxidase cbb3-type subunit I/II